MSWRKRLDKENTHVSAESQEDDVLSEKDEVSTLVAAREKRRREREHKSNNKEMTEEEMMALALRLSEQEANITAQRLQEEEEAVQKALQDSMFVESQSLMNAAGVSTRRKLVYSNGESRADTELSTSEFREGRGQRAAGPLTRTRKRMRVQGSPLMEMPDLSQTQPTPSSSDSAALGSPQSCDSTQIDVCDLPQSPIFPSSSVQVQVRVPRLDQDVLDSCASSGFVLCSQESGISTQSSQCQQPDRSPTFPKSPAPRSENSLSKSEAANSQMFDKIEDTQPESSQEPHTSPVFGQTDCKSALQADAVEPAVLTFSSQESSTSFCLEKDVSLSKTQGGEDSNRQSSLFGTNGRTVMSCGNELDEQEDQKDGEEQGLSQTEQTIDMTLHWSDEDEDNATPVVSPSPVFHEERSVLQIERENQESGPSDSQSIAPVPQSRSAVSFSGDAPSHSTVHYYWGVPFCPRGLDPDQYTKVIIAQMEVYEKSLKKAQRNLLNKAQWGEPILPQAENCPSPESNSPPVILSTRRSRRLRGKAMELESEEEVEVAEEAQGSQRCLWEEEEAQDEGDKKGKQDTENEEEEGQQKEPMEGAVSEELREDEAQVESDCEVCPETQLSEDITQELSLPSQPLLRIPEFEMVQVDSPDVPDVQTPQNTEPEEPMEQEPESQEEPKESTKPALFTHENMDVGRPNCETLSRESSHQDQNQEQSLVQTLDSEELSDPHLVPGPESPVQCPICQQVFPSNKIEVHAAFCDGAPAAGDNASPKLRRKRTRGGDTEDTNHTDAQPSAAQAQEKCYICLKAVPLREYSLHTDRCFQRPALRTVTTGGLLSALDQSEHKDADAGPSASTAQPQEVIELLDDDEEDSVSLIQISNSPIRSFTSISDAQDCLIDFSRQQQQDKRTRAKAGTKQRSKRR